MKKTQKSSIFIYGTTNQTKRIWTEYLASPDLEQLLTKTKKNYSKHPMFLLLSHFSEMVFLVVFGDKKVSRIPESYVGVCGSWPVRASKCNVTIRVFSMTEYKKCTQTLKIIPYVPYITNVR